LANTEGYIEGTAEIVISTISIILTLTAYFIFPHILIVGLIFIEGYFLIKGIIKLKIFSKNLFNPLFNDADLERENRTIQDISIFWFNTIKWLIIIGAISLITERINDFVLNTILFISYFLIYIYIIDCVVPYLKSFFNDFKFVIDLVLNLIFYPLNPDGTENQKNLAYRGRILKFIKNDRVNVAFTAILAIIILVMLVMVYISINHLAITLQNRDANCVNNYTITNIKIFISNFPPKIS
jgi:hypothetical protein